ncbi:MAG: AAA family ATPase, partial [Nitrospinae bacterium]|nr:AAA family ATPase [Nitrospinota bacterium]
MFFKQLELVGFKSFSEHHKLAFDRGINIVVGPNGCGKSNISDAIRWVLGEQSAKILRGQKMEDFIFSGSDKRKPSGYAKVSLTFEVDEGVITTNFGEYKEITVTRALYRTGESDYYVNKIPCRLKDITDIFM